MRKHLMAAASAVGLILSTTAFAQTTDSGATAGGNAGSVGVTPDIANDRGQTQPSGSSDVNSTTGEITGSSQSGGVGVTPEIANDRGQTQPSGSSTVNSTTGEATATSKEGGVGVTPNIANSRGQTQPSGSSRVNSTTGAINPDGCGATGMTQSNQSGTTADC